VLTTIRGVYRDGKIELLESGPPVSEAQVIVTFLPAGPSVDLRNLGIGEAQAAGLRSRLRTFAEDWDRPDMDVYDAE